VGVGVDGSTGVVVGVGDGAGDTAVGDSDVVVVVVVVVAGVSCVVDVDIVDGAAAIVQHATAIGDAIESEGVITDTDCLWGVDAVETNDHDIPKLSGMGTEAIDVVNEGRNSRL
jgi:hypothetical protein